MNWGEWHYEGLLWARSKDIPSVINHEDSFGLLISISLYIPLN